MAYFKNFVIECYLSIYNLEVVILDLLIPRPLDYNCTFNQSFSLTNTLFINTFIEYKGGGVASVA